MMKKKLAASGVCVLAAAALVAGVVFGGDNTTQTKDSGEASQDTIRLTGVVDTENGRKVYSTMYYLVESVNVKEGDTVNEGDVLAKLETSDLELDIAQQQAALDVQNTQTIQIPHQITFSRSDYYSVEQAKLQLESAKAKVDAAEENYRIASEQLNDNVNSAEVALSSAEVALTDAQTSYAAAQVSLKNALAKAQETFQQQTEEYQKAAAEWVPLEEEYLAEIEDNKEDVENAEINLSDEFPGSDSPTYQPDPVKMDRYEKLVNAIIDAKEELQASQEYYLQQKSIFQNIQDGYNQALNDYQNQVASISSLEASAKNDVEEAQKVVAAAEAQLNSAKQAQSGVGIARLQQDIENAMFGVDSAEVQIKRAESQAENSEQTRNTASSPLVVQNSGSQDISVVKQQDILDNASVTAPISGVVTAVYAKEGEPGNGLLFVIEDTESLKVITHIEEGDIGTVTEGMKVIIKSEATGDKEIPGTITYIAPTAVKNDAGNTIASESDAAAEFEAEVQIDEQNTGLRIGMNTTLTISLDEQEAD